MEDYNICLRSINGEYHIHNINSNEIKSLNLISTQTGMLRYVATIDGSDCNPRFYYKIWIRCMDNQQHRSNICSKTFKYNPMEHLKNIMYKYTKPCVSRNTEVTVVSFIDNTYTKIKSITAEDPVHKIANYRYSANLLKWISDRGVIIKHIKRTHSL